MQRKPTYPTTTDHLRPSNLTKKGSLDPSILYAPVLGYDGPIQLNHTALWSIAT